jgi:exopolysaccharide biosynthesis polyprenyl glycosylphosphotransferase
VDITNISRSLPDKVSNIEIKSPRKIRFVAHLLLFLSDFVAISVGFVVSQVLYLGTLEKAHGAVMLGALLPIYFGISILNRAHTVDVFDNTGAGISRSIQAFVFAVAALLLIVYVLKAGDDFSRFVFSAGVVTSALILSVNRYLANRTIRSFLKGASQITLVLRDGTSYHPIDGEFVVDPHSVGFDPTTQDPYAFDLLADLVGKADRVVVSCLPDRYNLWSSVLKGLNVRGEIISDAQIDIGVISLDWQGRHRTMVVSAGPLEFQDRFIKRTLDVIVSTGGLMILSPLLVLTAIAIRLESKGPALFLQTRVGRDNKLFWMFKFRSMYVDQCDADATQLTTRNDSRVSMVGKFIRRTSIDELPQLLNVLIGNMSIVGPRPHALSATAAGQLYWDVDPCYRHRHAMKPGITGLAQVRGFRGNTELAEDLTNRLQADLEYVTNWSIWGDFVIIVQTIFVIRHQNAF